MAVSNRDRIGRAFEQFAEGLAPYVERRMSASSPVGDKWFGRFVEQSKGLPSDASLRDPAVLLRVMADCWDLAFRSELRKSDRNVVFELRDVRNKWAHNEGFSPDDAYRALDSIERLLVAVDANEAEEVGRSKDDLMRLKYEAQAKKAVAKTDTALFDAAVAGLKPWREVVIPHEDVAQGKFALAEFAADLSQVHHGHGAAEYTDPVEFFRRTFLTAGLRKLLREAAERVSGNAGVPIVELQTNFGGGKTHSMIALYHLFSGAPVASYPQELQDVLAESDISELPSLPRVVLVGTKLKAGQADVKDDGTEVRTMWGELAWQLGGRTAFDLVAESDRTSTNPGDALDKLLDKYGPCLILIDEWVAYARQLYADDSLPGGTFDTHFSFAQALTEATRRAKGVLLVVSIPASENPDGSGEDSIGSEIEIGGVGGREALRRLRNVVGRMESSWRPASAEESFEIVRRRLFQPVDPALLTDRDATALSFGDFYRKQAAEFPGDCRDPRYVDRMKAAYPIHPELFARLYEDWSTLDRFQRTRGVLRLMAAVIHALWVGNDQSPMILPGNIPLEDAAVSAELERVLEDNWKPIIDRDIDGPASLPAEIDRQYPNLQQRMATRRVARAVFLGSAPTLNSPNRGIEAQRVRLGCAMPGEPPAIFGDALGKLAGRATYLYQEGNRYWYGVQESVNRTANDLAESFRTQRRDEVHLEITNRLKAEREKGEFASVHPCPASSSDVGDEPEVRLVILDPETPHVAKSDSSPALASAQEILDRRGNAPRSYRNMLVFLAADQRRLDELEQAAAEFLAWRTIDDQAEERNLDAHQRKQASTKRSQVDEAVRLRIAETYQWVLVPSQPDPGSPTLIWSAVKVDGQAPLAARASRKLANEGMLQTQFAPVLLRMQLDGPLAPLWAEGHARVSDIWDCFAKYLYLPRLRDVQVLLTCVEDGPASTVWQSEGFAVAAEEDAKSGRYLGLETGGRASHLTTASLIVQPSLAIGQLEQEERERSQHTGQEPTTPGVGGETGGGTDREGDAEPAATMPTRFHGTVTLQADRLNRDFGKVVQEVIEHLSALVGGSVEVTVDIAAQHDDGYPDQVVRAVTENARTLKFDPSSGFEQR